MKNVILSGAVCASADKPEAANNIDICKVLVMRSPLVHHLIPFALTFALNESYSELAIDVQPDDSARVNPDRN